MLLAAWVVTLAVVVALIAFGVRMLRRKPRTTRDQVIGGLAIVLGAAIAVNAPTVLIGLSCGPCP